MSIIGSNALAGASGASGAAAAGYEIERSLRFNDDDSAHLTKTFSSAGNQKTWTWSGWIKRGESASVNYFFGAGSTASDRADLFFQNTGELRFYSYFGSIVGDEKTTAKFNDHSAWYHIVVALDASNSTAADRIKFYVNGIEQAKTVSTNVTTDNHTINKAGTPHYVGARYGATSPFDGYITELHFIDGQALAPTDFGQYDDNNVWQPKAYSGTYGTNGYHLDFSDNSSTSALGTDSSGNSNDWTATNFSVASGAGNDSLIDTPTNYTASSGNNGGNYCTWNPLDKDADVALANGNLDMTQTAAGGVKGTIGVNSGKWYWEITKGSTANQVMGAATSDALPTTYSGGYAGSCGWATGTGTLFANTTSIFTKATTAGMGTATTGDVIGFALDLDSATKTLKFYKNGSLITNNHIEIADSDLHIHPVIGTNVADTGANVANFGQRPFVHTPPTDHLPLCTTNLPDPTIGDGSTVMDVSLWTGNSTSQTISGLGFSPDLVWIKNRAQTDNHKLLDTMRGATEELESNTSDAEVTNTDGLTAFNSDGFDLGADAEYNTNTETYVSWTWDAGTSTVSNTDGSTTSSVRANSSAGFSIATYTGNGTAGTTIGHGLGAAPGMILVKRRDSTVSWVCYHQALGSTHYILLDTAGTAGDSEFIWNDTDPTSSVFSLGIGGGVNTNSGTYVAYCWAPVEGYSRFGSYTGNGSTTGEEPFVYTGFRPRWLLIKAETGASATDWWFLWDSERVSYNPNDTVLYPNDALQEQSNSDREIDMLANGFRLRTGQYAGLNESGTTYIYSAFAEHPFKTARAR